MPGKYSKPIQLLIQRVHCHHAGLLRPPFGCRAQSYVFRCMTYQSIANHCMCDNDNWAVTVQGHRRAAEKSSKWWLKTLCLPTKRRLNPAPRWQVQRLYLVNVQHITRFTSLWMTEVKWGRGKCHWEETSITHAGWKTVKLEIILLILSDLRVHQKTTLLWYFM